MSIGVYVTIVIGTISLAVIGTVTCSYCEEIALKNVTYPYPFSLYDGEDYKLDINIVVGNDTNPEEVDEDKTATILCDYSPRNETLRNETTFYFKRYDCPGVTDSVVVQADRRNFYTIYDVTTVDETSYKCEASGPLGYISTDDSVQLNVNEKHIKPSPPKPPRKANYSRLGRPTLSLFLTGPQTTPKDVTIGSTTVLKCIIPTPNRLSPFTFYLNGTRIAEDRQENFTNGAFLEIPSIQKSDVGNYKCSRKDPVAGPIFSNTYKLKVYDNQECISNPLNVTLKLNGNADAIQFEDKNSTIVFTCEVPPNLTETEILNIRWYMYNNTEIKLNRSIGLHIFKSSMVIHGIGYIAEAIYSCRVKTKEGVSCSNSIILDVFGLKIKEYDDEILRMEQQIIKDKLIKPGLPRLQIQLSPMNRLEGGYVDAFIDVYLACNVEPKNTSIREFSWFLRDLRLYTDESLGITSEGSHLIMRTIKVADAGEYVCQGLLDNGTEIYSEPYLLRVRHPAGFHNCVPQTRDAPKALLHFENDLEHGQFLDLGDNISMICDVYPNMTSNITYRWFLEGREKIPDGVRIQTNDTILAITNFEKIDAGNYVCEAKTELGTVYSNWVKITIPEYKYNATSPKYDVQLTISLGEILDPNDIKEDDTIYFVCKMFPKILDAENLIWFHNRFEISPEDYPSYKFSNQTLVIENITKEAAGSYKCKLESNQGYILSKSIEIKVKDKFSDETNHTSHTKTPDNATAVIEFADGIKERIKEKEDLYLKCVVKPETVFINHSFYWNHKLRELNTTADHRITIISRGAKSVLIIQGVDKSFKGWYDCGTITMENTYLGTMHSKQLDVKTYKTNVLPRARVRLMNSENITGLVKESETAFFLCDVEYRGNEIPDVRWYHNNTLLHRNNEIEILDKASVLVLTKISKHLTGSYHCDCKVISDTDDFIKSEPVFIKVVDRHTTQKTDSKAVVVIAEPVFEPAGRKLGDRDMEFKCNVLPSTAYDPSFPIRWYLNGEILSGDGYKIDKQFLYVNKIRKEDLGNYNCRAVSKDGEFFFSTISVQFSNIEDRIPVALNRPKTPERTPDVVAELQTDPENIYVNDTVYLYCNVTPKTKIISLEWFHEIQEINSENGYFMGSEDNRTLVIRNISRNALGKYFCRIRTRKGPFESEPTSITQIKNETLVDRSYWDKGNVGISVNLKDSTLTNQFYEANNAIFTCTILPESTIVISITWYRNNNPLLISKKNLQDNRTLIVRDLSVYDTGAYKCMANTTKGTFSSSPVPLRVAEIRSIVAELQDCPGLYYENMLAYFYCVIEPPTIKILNLTWYRNGRILNAAHGKIPFKTNKDYRLLTLYFIKKSYEGYYACEIITEHGIYRSKPTPLLGIREGESPYALGKHEPYLKMEVPRYSSFVTKDKAHVYEAQEHSNLQINCQIKPESTQILNLTWYFNSTQISTRETDIRKFRGCQKQIMLLNDISLNATGVYYCKADTKKGPARSKSSLRLIVHPVKPPSSPATKP